MNTENFRLASPACGANEVAGQRGDGDKFDFENDVNKNQWVASRGQFRDTAHTNLARAKKEGSDESRN